MRSQTVKVKSLVSIYMRYLWIHWRLYEKVLHMLVSSMTTDQIWVRNLLCKATALHFWIYMVEWIIAFWTASKCLYLKSVKIVILRIFEPSLLASFFWLHLGTTFQFLIYFVWPRITSEDTILDICIWSILLIQSDLKMMFLSNKTSLFLDYSLRCIEWSENRRSHNYSNGIIFHTGLAKASCWNWVNILS